MEDQLGLQIIQEMREGFEKRDFKTFFDWFTMLSEEEITEAPEVTRDLIQQIADLIVVTYENDYDHNQVKLGCMKILRNILATSGG